MTVDRSCPSATSCSCRRAVTFFGEAKKVTRKRRPRHSPGFEISSKSVARCETRCAQTTDRFIDVFGSNLGDGYTGSIERILDRFAMG